jgi:hypothetical protein
MAEDMFDNDNGSDVDRADAIRIFIFKSEARPDLRAFGGDLAGISLPSQFKPWRVVGAVAPNQELPYKISRVAVQTAIKDSGFQLFRIKNKAKDA